MSGPFLDFGKNGLLDFFPTSWFYLKKSQYMAIELRKFNWVRNKLLV